MAPATVNAADMWLKFLSLASPSKRPFEISSGVQISFVNAFSHPTPTATTHAIGSVFAGETE